MAHQVSVFAENKPGQIERLTEVLAGAGIDIRAVTIATSDSFGVVKLLVNDPAAANRALREAGLSSTLRQIVALSMDDRPGGMHRVAAVLGRAGVNIEDAYGFVIEGGKRAVLVIEVENIAGVETLLDEQGLVTLSDEEIYSL